MPITRRLLKMHGSATSQTMRRHKYQIVLTEFYGEHSGKHAVPNYHKVIYHLHRLCPIIPLLILV